MPLDRPADSHPDLRWLGWGDVSRLPELPAAVRQLLADGLGVRAAAREPQSPALAAPRLGQSEIDALADIVGPEHCFADRESRLVRTRGKSTPDLLRARQGDVADAPDLVLQPAWHEQVLEVLRTCSERRIAVVPFGGGTSVVGGLAPAVAGYTGLVALDLRRLNALVHLDEVSRVAEFEPGLRGPQAEQLLGARGYTIGHFPQSFEYATLGGFAAARSSGQASAGYGRFDELVVRVRVATPAGTLEAGRAPKSAAGPDLRQLILGSEGAFGVITSLSVAVRPVPERRVYEGWRFDTFPAGMDSLRRLAQDGPLPTVLRLSDETETALNLARPQDIGAEGQGGCLAIVGYEGTVGEVEFLRSRVSEVLIQAGAQPAPDAGPAWEHGRYRGPYLRDALLDAGALVETLETAGFWSTLPQLYRAVSEALQTALGEQGTPPVILCHVSHVYASGASLYFTVACAQADDAVAQWAQAKAAAGDAILAAGGSITHHHGVGRDHLRWYLEEAGELGISALRAVKDRLDPAGIMNPGVLLPR